MISHASICSFEGNYVQLEVVMYDIFEEYAGNVRLVSVKTTNMGSLYKLLYRIELTDRAKTKEFIDALRTRNGNLEISITESAERGDEL